MMRQMLDNLQKRPLLLLSLFLAASAVLFLPVINRNFGSDDFSVLYRDVYGQSLFTKDFFRPLSDITLYMSYLMGGFNPIYYNLFNIALHAACCSMLFYFCLMDNGIAVKHRYSFACFSAVLFLIYPFHNESIVWVLGRASMTSCFFGFLSLIIAFSDISTARKNVFSPLSYFIGLSGYETILPLPAIILLLHYRKGISVRHLISTGTFYAIALAVNMGIRYRISGVIYGNYGARMFEPSVKRYLLNLFKVAGRLFLPPTNTSSILIFFSVLGIIAFGLLTIAFSRSDKIEFQSYIKLTFSVLLSVIIPVLFGVSTRTYEGDRLFYFASFFLCMWIAYAADYVSLCRAGWLIKPLIAIFFLFFFYQSLFTWKKAGEITTSIISDIRSINRDSGKLFLINLPEEYNGAQILRSGLGEALLINKIDTTAIIIVNHLSSEYALKVSGQIKPEFVNSQNLYIPPATIISKNLIQAKLWSLSTDNDSTHQQYNSNTDKIYYWNKKSLVLLSYTF
ncbi:MAG: hypothetical protein QM726_06925 [Chitinophagaceae bacterium]